MPNQAPENCGRRIPASAKPPTVPISQPQTPKESGESEVRVLESPTNPPKEQPSQEKSE